MLKKLLKDLSEQRQRERAIEHYRNLMRREAKIGGTLFGEIPNGHRREFFCLDEHTWVWHEEWRDESGPKLQITRYNIRPDAILKSTNSARYQQVSPEEAYRLYQATQAYKSKIDQLYATR